MRNILAILVILVATASGFAQSEQNKLVGKVAPELKVGNWLNTKSAFSLSKLKGKVVVLDFWAYW